MIKDLLNRKEKDPFLADVQSTINSLDGIVAAITQTNSKLQSRLTFAFATKLIPLIFLFILAIAGAIIGRVLGIV